MENGRRNNDAVRVSEELTRRRFCFGGFLQRLGGQWDATVKVWRIAYGLIRGSALEKRIVQTTDG